MRMMRLHSDLRISCDVTSAPCRATNTSGGPDNELVSTITGFLTSLHTGSNLTVCANLFRNFREYAVDGRVALPLLLY